MFDSKQYTLNKRKAYLKFPRFARSSRAPILNKVRLTTSYDHRFDACFCGPCELLIFSLILLFICFVFLFVLIYELIRFDSVRCSLSWLILFSISIFTFVSMEIVI